MNILSSLPARVASSFYYPRVFGHFGKGSLLYAPLLLTNPRHISIGNGVHIRQGARLEVIVGNSEHLPSLSIGDNVNIEQHVHIVCHHRIRIEPDVSITGFCTIVDTTHPVDGLEPGQKMGNLISEEESYVEIGRGAFIGMGVRILPNVRIGSGAVIGANSVVTHDVPDFCIATGIPARVQRRRQLVP
jgi:acetyltransferase-like isoleucine patch superfamily enzyme